MVKKNLFFFAIVFPVIFSACGEKESGNDNSGLVIKTGRVTFVNESGYGVVVHAEYFSGPVLLEMSAGDFEKTINVRTSDNYGIGSTFSIEYLHQITEGINAESGEVIASGIDPNVQINRVIEENKSYTIQIPQPANLEPRSAFITILNNFNLPFELMYLSTAFKQTGNGNLSVAPYKTGVYKLEGIPSEGKLYQNYQVVSTFASVTISDFTAKNGGIYDFDYDGTSVTKRPVDRTFVFK
jgi:hypothetical protein